MRNLAQTVTEEYFPREEFSISAWPYFAGSEAPASVEITVIFRPRALVLTKPRRVRIKLNQLDLVNLGVNIIITNRNSTPRLSILEMSLFKP